MRITGLVDHPEHVCCRYRLTAFRQHFERAGHALEVRMRPRRLWDWLQLGRDIRSSDVVVLQRRLLQPWQLFLLRRACRFLVFDFDDAVFLRDSYASKGMHSLRRQRAFAAICRAADAVVAGNGFLGSHACQWTDTARVAVIPTCVDPAGYTTRRQMTQELGGPVKLVWIGSRSTMQGLEAMRPTLEELGRREPRLQLKMICDHFLNLHNLPVIRCPWSEANEAAEISAADIGISWIPDDDWSRGKCGLKVLQYMAARLPVVANRVGVHADMIQHGKTGFLASTPEQWRDAILALTADVELRARLGRMGSDLLEDQYSVTRGAESWLRLLARARSQAKVA